MRSPLIIRMALTLCNLVFLSGIVLAQGTLADYERATGLRAKYEAVSAGMPESANWIGDTTRFWYRKSVKGGHEFLLFDAETREKRPAFDHEKIAAALSAGTGRKYTAVTLPFNSITFRNGEKALEVRVEGNIWNCSLSEYTCTKSEPTGPWERRQPLPPCSPPGPEDTPRVSPDGKLEAFITNYNIAVRAPGSREFTVLSTDGSEGNCYELRSIAWSPDSSKVRGLPPEAGISKARPLHRVVAGGSAPAKALDAVLREAGGRSRPRAAGPVPCRI
jgi:hypothetical protein